MRKTTDMHEVIVGLGFGDESKGSAVDWLCHERDIAAVIRYNGGPQCGHNVVQPDGRHHEFAQFGSGSFHGVPTHLSQYMLVNPFAMYEEAKHLSELGLGDPFDNTTVADRALLVTPYHRAANRLREDRRGSLRHGSTGHGVGETRWYSLKYPTSTPRIGDMARPHVLRNQLTSIRDHYTWELGDLGVEETPEELAAQYLEMTEYLRIVPDAYIKELLDAGDCVFEGGQGVLLDEKYGFHPHTTWTNTTAGNARTLLGHRDYRVIGLTRTYHTRHGAGPFPTEGYEVNSLNLPEPHNNTGEYQGSWRIGSLDLSLLDYAVRAVGEVDVIMVSHMDVVSQGLIATYGYTDWTKYALVPFDLERLRLPTDRDEQIYLTEFFSKPEGVLVPAQYDLMCDGADVTRDIETITGVPVEFYSHGPTYKDKWAVGRERV